MYTYEMPPIDSWNECPTLADVLREKQLTFSQEEVWRERWAELLDFFATACMRLGRTTDWEGDIVGPVCVLLAPDPDSSEMVVTGFALKQSENGTTFAASKFPLPNLERWMRARPEDGGPGNNEHPYGPPKWRASGRGGV